MSTFIPGVTQILGGSPNFHRDIVNIINIHVTKYMQYEGTADFLSAKIWDLKDDIQVAIMDQVRNNTQFRCSVYAHPLHYRRANDDRVYLALRIVRNRKAREWVWNIRTGAIDNDLTNDPMYDAEARRSNGYVLEPNNFD